MKEYCRQEDRLSTKKDMQDFFNKSINHNLKYDPLEGKVLTSGTKVNSSYISCFSVVSKTNVNKSGYLESGYIKDIRINDYSLENHGFIFIRKEYIKKLKCALDDVSEYKNDIYCRSVEYLSIDDYFDRATNIERGIAKYGIDLNTPLREFEAKYYGNEEARRTYGDAIEMLTLNKVDYFKCQHEARIGINTADTHKDKYMKFKARDNICSYFKIYDSLEDINKFRI